MNRFFIKGLKQNIQRRQENASWYEIILKARLQGWMDALDTILEEIHEEDDKEAQKNVFKEKW